jgi:hypothetical protein
MIVCDDGRADLMDHLSAHWLANISIATIGLRYIFGVFQTHGSSHVGRMIYSLAMGMS